MINLKMIIILTVGLFLDVPGEAYAASVQIVEPDLLFILGPIESGDDQKLFSLAKELEGRQKNISIYISSRGGATGPALRIGQWIKKKAIDVHVGKECFSSCANYIFPSGKNKILHESVIGFHGSPSATFKKNPELVRRILREMPAQEWRRNKYENADAARADVEFVLANEGTFFASLGVDNAIFEKTVDAEERQKLGCAGHSQYFAPSIKQMKELGIESVSGTIDTRLIQASENRLCATKDPASNTPTYTPPEAAPGDSLSAQ